MHYSDEVDVNDQQSFNSCKPTLRSRYNASPFDHYTPIHNQAQTPIYL